MKYLLTFIITIFLFSLCNKPENEFVKYWEIISLTHNNSLFEKDDIIVFSKRKIYTNSLKTKKEYTYIRVNNQIVIETSSEKWLFEIEENDSSLIFRELYNKDPLIIEMKKNDLDKKHTATK